MLSPGADRQTRGSSLFLRPGKLKEASRRDFHSPSATDRHRHRHRHRQGTSSHCQESYLDLLILFANATIISTNVGSPSAPDQTCFCSTMLMPLSTMFTEHCSALREIEEEKNYNNSAHLAEEKIIATGNMSLNIVSRLQSL